jgi:hypothetical protein
VLHFGPEDGGDVFLPNVGLSNKYTVLYLRRPHFENYCFVHYEAVLNIEYAVTVKDGDAGKENKAVVANFNILSQ